MHKKPELRHYLDSPTIYRSTEQGQRKNNFIIFMCFHNRTGPLGTIIAKMKAQLTACFLRNPPVMALFS